MIAFTSRNGSAAPTNVILAEFRRRRDEGFPDRWFPIAYHQAVIMHLWAATQSEDVFPDWFHGKLTPSSLTSDEYDDADAAYAGIQVVIDQYLGDRPRSADRWRMVQMLKHASLVLDVNSRQGLTL